MVAFNVSVHNSSPLISYTAAWLDTPLGDAYAANYSGAGFHTTSIAGASVSFKFNGTGVWFYGAHRPQYGSYSVSVDGNTLVNGSAAASNPVFDQFLGGAGNLGMGEHTAVLTNTGGGAIDLDSLIFEAHVGADDQQVAIQTVEDTNLTVTFLPTSTSWNVSSSDIFMNGTAHYTNVKGANATLSFTGDAIAVYGGVSFDHGDFTVSLDGQTQQLNGANGQARIYHAQSLLYFASGLGDGKHDLAITVGTGYFDLDSIHVLQATGGKENNNTNANSDDPSSGGMEASPPINPHVDANNGGGNTAPDNNAAAAAKTKAVPGTVIAGIVAASIVGFISILTIVMFLLSQCRKRREWKAQQAQPHPFNNGDSPVLPIQEPDLEKGVIDIAVFEEKKVDGDDNLKRSTSRFTVKSFASRWSQASFMTSAARDTEVPPVPPMPRMPGLPSTPKLNLTVPSSQRQRSGSITSSGSNDSTLRAESPDDDSVLDDYYYRNSTVTTTTTTTNSVAPLRPARPPGLNLGDLGPKFDNVPL